MAVGKIVSAIFDPQRYATHPARLIVNARALDEFFKPKRGKNVLIVVAITTYAHSSR